MLRKDRLTVVDWRNVLREVVALWDDLVVYLMNSRSGIAPGGETVRSVENEVCSDQLLRARFGFMAELFELSEYYFLIFRFL